MYKYILKKKNNWCTVYCRLWSNFVVYMHLWFFFLNLNFIVSYQASKIHLLCVVYKCWGWTKSTKVYIYSSQKGHDRQKIRRGNNIWSIGKEQEQKEQLRYEMSIEHITTQKAM